MGGWCGRGTVVYGKGSGRAAGSIAAAIVREGSHKRIRQMAEFNADNMTISDISRYVYEQSSPTSSQRATPLPQPSRRPTTRPKPTLPMRPASADRVGCRFIRHRPSPRLLLDPLPTTAIRPILLFRTKRCIRKRNHGAGSGAKNPCASAHRPEADHAMPFRVPQPHQTSPRWVGAAAQRAWFGEIVKLPFSAGRRTCRPPG